MPRKTPHTKPSLATAKPTDKVQVLVYLELRVHRSLKEETALRHMSMGEIITEALENRVWIVHKGKATP